MPELERQSTKNISPNMAFLFGTRDVQLEKTQRANRLSPANRSALALEQIYQRIRAFVNKEAALPPLVETEGYPRRMNRESVFPRLHG